VPVGSFMIATEELPDDLTRRLVPKGRVLADTRRVLSYFRLSPDGRRVLWGGRVGTGPLDLQTSARRLYKVMCTVWPELQDYKVTHSWMGNVAFTFDFLPHLGVENGMHYALGCQGSGVAMQTWLGTQAALKIAGASNRPSAFDGLPFPTMPLYSGNPWFLPGVLAWYKVRDAIDRQFDSTGTA
jgi:glycine/D-amino acid oxidase-like deaminating enzyme